MYQSLLILACASLCWLGFGCAGAVHPSSRLDDEPTTAPAHPVAPTYKEAIELVDQILKPLSRYSPEHETINERYSLIRYYNGYRNYAPDGRPRFVARVTVDSWTGELIELRGDYEDNEIEKIERYRPRDIITPEEAIAIAENAIQNPPLQNAPPLVSRADIDLVARRYYIIRFPNVPRPEGSLAPYYTRRITIDGKTKKVLNYQIG